MIGHEYEYSVRDGAHRIFLWVTTKGERVFAEAASLRELAEAVAANPHAARVPGQLGYLERLLREEDERMHLIECAPDRRVYGPGLTRDEAEARHARFLRSGWSMASSDAYHRVESRLMENVTSR